MKTLLTLTLCLSLPSLALATGRPSREDRDAARKSCAFGESTADLSDQLELRSGAPGKIWYKGEHLSLFKTERLNGLSSDERKMILLARGSAPEQDEKEALEDFSRSEGYITYFSHNSLDRHFAIVASYPGDNEYGAILEIKTLRRRGEYKILSVVAAISDGDLEDCKLRRDEVNGRR